LNPLRNIIFDLDGTLIDSSKGVVDAVNYSLRKAGQPEQPAERIKPFIGFPLSQMYPVFTDASLDELCSHFQERARETMVSSTVPLDGAADVIRQLQGYDVRLAIASTKIRPHIEGILAKMRWQEFFSAVVGSDQVTRVKPEPDAFRLALKLLGGAAEQTIVVGDTVNDVYAARAVPVESVGVISPYGDDTELRESQPDHMLHAIGELPALIIPRLKVKRAS
jgi:HAD superfamily hydrolase (TIGR01509 family)